MSSAFDLRIGTMSRSDGICSAPPGRVSLEQKRFLQAKGSMWASALSYRSAEGQDWEYDAVW